MYKLQSETLGIVRDSKGKLVALTLPADSIVKVVSREPIDGTVDVVWKNQIVNLFALDLQARGTIVEDNS